ncbi:hypothetical protein [Arsenicicoccus sp. oral taxon 190]|uniref:hypothetical protein n=1 Tax=Arsenicicoccus sp. oral taxon 190 TaxID=1658671 RepID=UPI00067A2D38|nr:hypothetical protein [Arsenicicoccus sp. oral taxon 190]AKT50337.1 hypothetical protein ADJ73_01605 [Arsenicicoccus sp. oral taxon 190]
MSLGEPLGGPVVLVDRGDGVNGELALRWDGADFEVIANGVFLMDTRRTASERRLVRAVLARARPGARLLVGGLGVGASVHEALQTDVGAVDVVEIEPLVVTWWERYLRAHWGLSATDLARVRIATMPLQAYAATPAPPYDAIALDTDNGPDWLVAQRNSEIYEPDGLRAVARMLAPGGVCGYWSASPSPAFERRLREVYAEVTVELVDRGAGPPDVVHVCAAPRVSGSSRAAAPPPRTTPGPPR